MCVYSLSVKSLCFSFSQEQSCLSQRATQSSNFHKHITQTNCQKSLPPRPHVPSVFLLLNPRTLCFLFLCLPPFRSLQVHRPRALRCPRAAVLHQNLRQVQEKHRGASNWSADQQARSAHPRSAERRMTNSICRRACLISGMRPSEAAFVCFVFALVYCLCSLPSYSPPSSPGSAGNASFLGGGELPHQVRQVPQNREVLPGPDRAPLRVVSNHGKPPPEERQPPPHYIPTVSWV